MTTVLDITVHLQYRVAVKCIDSEARLPDVQILVLTLISSVTIDESLDFPWLSILLCKIGIIILFMS